MPALQNYFDAERQRRGWSMREAADRSQISLSKAYAIVRGDDNVEFETFENIASAFGLTPAELATAIGKGRAEDDPARTAASALLYQVPDEHVGMVESIIRTFTRVSTHPNDPVNPRKKRTNSHSKGADPGSDTTLRSRYDYDQRGLTLSGAAA